MHSAGFTSRIRDCAIRGIRNEEKRWLAFASVVSLLYGGIIRLRNAGYNGGILKSKALACPVVSVGNITAGGTGKTPMVIMLASEFRKRGFRPAILSRGYGGKNKEKVTVVTDGSTILKDFEKAGDEPVLIAESLERVPVITSKKRINAGNLALCRYNPDVLILDDAFQHRSLCRDIDIVLVDGRDPFGKGAILPKGELREPETSARRADIIVVTDSGCDATAIKAKEQIKKICPGVSIFEANRKPLNIIEGFERKKRPLSYLKGKNVLAFAGIALPERFRMTVEELCGIPCGFVTYPDHYLYSAKDIAGILHIARAQAAELIITTAKDAVRLRKFPDFYRKVCYLAIEMDMGNSLEPFLASIMRKLNR
ncbi:MAG: tetraacyldisaccharide 4'-kinase [Syntrophales bacterium]|jgi:tetraacyldisaccharide 4'-kinase|nr:tetraacyldisaccharide 4'-kinase [Syntrophales bacterium]MDY0044519.1 tetraacyldisaccharide 4'-kinase [Syntrophales bacterium]